MAISTIGGSTSSSSSNGSGVATGYTYARFNSSGTFTLPAGYGANNPLNIDVIAVGGGGAGGNNYYGGGGGAGELVLASYAATANCSVTIGAGGTTVSGSSSAGIGGTGGTTTVASLATQNYNYAQNSAARYGNGSVATNFTSGGYQNAYWNTSGTQQGGYNGSFPSLDPFGNNLSTQNGKFYGFARGQWNNNGTENQYTYTQTGLTIGVTYAISFYYSFSYASGNGDSITSTGTIVNGTKTPISTPGSNVWNQFTTTWTATSTSVTFGIYGTNTGANTFFVGYQLGYIRVIEASTANPYTWGGHPDDGSGSFAWAGVAGSSTVVSYPIVARAYGGGGGGAGNTSNILLYGLGVAPTAGGSGGGNGVDTATADNISNPTSVTAGSAVVLRNRGGASARTQFPMGASNTINHIASGGGGGALSAGGDADWFNAIGGKGGTAYDANSWCGQTTTLAANILAGGGAGWGLKGIGAASTNAGQPTVNAPYNTGTTMKTAVSPTANTGSGGAGAGGAQNTATNGASGVVIIRYKA